jgi:hypothetical protein
MTFTTSELLEMQSARLMSIASSANQIVASNDKSAESVASCESMCEQMESQLLLEQAPGFPTEEVTAALNAARQWIAN